jgi:hypothetical protein
MHISYIPDSEKRIKILTEFEHSKPEEWEVFIEKYRSESDKEKRQNEVLQFCGMVKSKKKKEENEGEEKKKEKPDSQQYALRRNLREILELDNPEAPNVIEDIKFHLAMKRMVILDLSLMTLDMAYRVAHLILDGIFSYNLEGITAGKIINTIAVFEESQNVLHKKAVEEGKSIFTRWAKEGRKFNLGLIYVTQQPGAIAEEIVSQTDNFFIMHILNKGDIDALKRANPHYNGVISEFLASETFVGNTYIYSAPLQPYVFPAKIAQFNKDFFDTLEAKAPKVKTEDKNSVLDELKDIAKHLEPLATKKYEKFSKFVGACSHRIYEYFQKKGVSVPFMDNENRRIDYGIAQNLVKILQKKQLLKLPAEENTDT